MGLLVEGLAVRKSLQFSFLVLGVISGLLGCSPREQDSTSVSLRVALVATFVSDESVEAFATYLRTGPPDYNDAEKAFSVIGISAGNSEADPMSVMAGTTTGEFSEIVGLDLSERRSITEVTGIANPQMFILTGSPNLEAATAAFRFLAQAQ